jgi:trehalose-6-phosphate synthase
MQRLARQVDEQNIYRWAANFLSALAAERTTGTEAANISKAAGS